MLINRTRPKSTECVHNSSSPIKWRWFSLYERNANSSSVFCVWGSYFCTDAVSEDLHTLTRLFWFCLFCSCLVIFQCVFVCVCVCVFVKYFPLLCIKCCLKSILYILKLSFFPCVKWSFNLCVCCDSFWTEHHFQHQNRSFEGFSLRSVVCFYVYLFVISYKMSELLMSVLWEREKNACNNLCMLLKGWKEVHSS